MTDESRWGLEPSSAPGRRRPSARLDEHGGRRRTAASFSVHLDPMLVATRSFTTRYDGLTVEIKRPTLNASRTTAYLSAGVDPSSLALGGSAWLA